MAFNLATLTNFSLQNNKQPKEGPRTVPVLLDFTAVQSYALDFKLLMQQKKLSVVQTIYVDNSLNAQAFILTLGTTQQILTWPPFSQGYMPILASGEPSLTVQTTGGVALFMQLLNFDVNPSIWSASATSGTVVGGKQSVSDAILEAGVVSGFYQAQMFNTANAGVVKPNWKGDKPFNTTTATIGPNNVIAAQGGATGWAITDLNISITGNASQAAGGNFIVSIQDGGLGNILSKTIFVPAVAGTTIGENILFNFNGIGYNSKAANGAMTVTLSAALVTGAVNVNGFFANTPIVT